MIVDLKRPETKRLEIPHEPGEWIEVRRLSGSQESSAFTDQKTGKARTIEESMAELFSRAVVAWSYDAPTVKASYMALDAVTRDWLIEQIMAWDRQTVTDAERGNATAPSIDS